jgi:hypothetical protein
MDTFCCSVNKYTFLFGQDYKKQFVTNFQNHCNEHEHHLLWIKDALMYGINTNEEIENFVDKYIHVIFHYHHLHYKMHNNINTFKHIRKNHVIDRFQYYPLPPMSTKTFYIHLNQKRTYLLAKTYLQQQAIFFFEFIKNSKQMRTLHSLNF